MGQSLGRQLCCLSVVQTTAMSHQHTWPIADRKQRTVTHRDVRVHQVRHLAHIAPAASDFVSCQKMTRHQLAATQQARTAEHLRTGLHVLMNARRLVSGDGVITKDFTTETTWSSASSQQYCGVECAQLSSSHVCELLLLGTGALVCTIKMNRARFTLLVSCRVLQLQNAENHQEDAFRSDGRLRDVPVFPARARVEPKRVPK
jgi:hypothetical protein